ncbi:expressed unknown protein [Seminavis robusta]|uniref:Uncharacterized protein n=1 Tax=Seminavis robusta TaxID=568900 RepID=A0A9N8E2N9_9STRA|nr:expressed unknown protein [Seminavis robusta]|eukprot:Sro593_g172360.1 n/a (239) ;mRNA; r:55165-55881
MCEHEVRTSLDGDSPPTIIRRQVSDLGMEDPVMLQTRRRGKKKNAAEIDSTASTCGAAAASAESSAVEQTEEEEDDDVEMDLEELMSSCQQDRSCVTRTTSVSSGSRGGSMALRAMSDSFNNSSFNSAGSSGTACQGSSQDFSSSHHEDSFSNHLGENAPATPTGTGRVGRKLPARSGSGYVRGVGAASSGSASRRASLRKSSTNGLATAAVALREKRRSRGSLTTQLARRPGRSEQQ